MRTYGSDTYFKTQSSALQYVEDQLSKKFQIAYPENIWTEHVHYGTSVSYHLPLNTLEGKPTRRWVHITLYRMDSGNYELTFYKS
jgi:hypothetical protein